MKVILYDRKNLKDESILLKGLLENGKIANFKIPGILKSKKRSSFFFYPCTLWDFTFLPQEKKIIIPKETHLIKSCIDDKSSYRLLNDIHDFLYPLKFFYSENDYKIIYHYLEQFINEFSTNNKTIKESMKDHFYVFWIHFEGLLDTSERCSKCSRAINLSDYTSLRTGNLCKECVNLESDSSIIPYEWIQNNLNKKEKILLYNSPEIRKKIISFFQTI